MAGIEYLSPEGFRVDGRRPHEIRSLHCQVGVFQQADGSSFLEHGNTKVLASVYGPRNVSRQSSAVHDRAVINCQFSMATFSTSERRKGGRDRKAIDLTRSLKQIFESAIMTEVYPQSEININVQVLQEDGGEFGACINAATMALVDAGIPVKDMVCACSVAFIEETTMLDVNHLEATASAPVLTVATFPKFGTILLLRMESRLHLDSLEKVMKVAVEGCLDVNKKLDKIIKTNLEKHYCYTSALQQ